MSHLTCTHQRSNRHNPPRHGSPKLCNAGMMLVAALQISACQLLCPENSLEEAAQPPEQVTAELGTGPGHTAPLPHSGKVNLEHVRGATPHYEPLIYPDMNSYRVRGRCYEIWHGRRSYVETGLAAWYGPGFEGKHTASGERFERRAFTAAHRNLPLPSYLKVTNLSNGRAVIVRVNDRGPFTPGRIIDLAEGAAQAIGITGRGEQRVRLEYIDVHNNTRPPLTPGSAGGCSGTQPDMNPSRSGSYLLVLHSADQHAIVDAEERLRSATSLELHVQYLSDGHMRVVAGPLAAHEITAARTTLNTLGFTPTLLHTGRSALPSPSAAKIEESK